ncbi:GT-D fold domain-containing protein [Paenibacillus koleovorans]|uniref:GT-D fold domain-containing protein n=1 Tax=Paenibacillus koleovorans TaxID=121608 RepID=UPI001FE7E8D1|nr:GT-D fold domain-containing glycosyltransferase [Paenibacillus koleovorans]
MSMARITRVGVKKKGVIRRKRLFRRGGRVGKRGLSGKSPAFNNGYNLGFDKGHAEGYRHGRYDGEAGSGWKDGVEGMIDRLIPGFEVLPEVSAEEVLAAGVEAMRGRFLHLLTPEELGGRILQALDSRSPFSVVRLGDGELLTLAQGSVLSIQQVKEQGPFLSYAGVDVPDYDARDRLVESIRLATAVGIPKLRVRNYQPLAFDVFRAHGIDYNRLLLTDSLINYYLYQSGFLKRITEGRRVLVIGNLAEKLGEVLRGGGMHVVGTISPVNGVADVPRVLEESASYEFDLAFVAAGIAAVILSQRIATDLGRVAVDFGHLANSMIKGEAPFK